MRTTSIDKHGRLIYNFGGEDFQIIGATKQNHPGHTDQETGVIWRMREKKYTDHNARIAACNCANNGPQAAEVLAGVAFRLCLRCGRIIA